MGGICKSKWKFQFFRNSFITISSKNINNPAKISVDSFFKSYESQNYRGWDTFTYSYFHAHIFSLKFQVVIVRNRKMPVHEDIMLFQKLSELIVSGAELLRNTHARFFLDVSQWGEILSKKAFLFWARQMVRVSSWMVWKRNKSIMVWTRS